MAVIPEELQHHWTAINPLLSIRNEHEYDLAGERLNRRWESIGRTLRMTWSALLVRERAWVVQSRRCCSGRRSVFLGVEEVLQGIGYTLDWRRKEWTIFCASTRRNG